jgi:phage terminase large subunit-like protein
MAKWDACAKPPVDIDALLGRDCYAGLDLASTSDITAFVLLFPAEDGGFTVLPHFWLPEATVRKRSRADGVRYDTWVASGLIRQTSGDWCDYTALEADILELSKKFNIKQVNFDPKEASMLSQKLLESGVAMTPFIQSFSNYNEPVKFFETLIGKRKLRHGGNPVLQWMADNVALDHNVAQLRMPSKSRSQDKIDGIIASIMGLASAMTGDGQSVYNSRGLFVL